MTKNRLFEPQDVFYIREAPALDCHNDFLKTFAIFKLSQVLADFGVGPFESDTVIRWFWKAARSWPAKKSQIEFDQYARARVSDYVGYTRKRLDAFNVIDRLFDKARFVGVTFDEVIDAVAFVSKSEPMPEGMVIENGTSALVDLTKRADSPKVLKIDLDFLPALRKLYPFDRVDDVVVKNIPVSDRLTREFPIRKFAFWQQHPKIDRVELDEALACHNGDLLDWRRANLYSEWAERAAQVAAGMPEEYSEGLGQGGRTFILRD
jgi:hypothetical protein